MLYDMLIITKGTYTLIFRCSTSGGGCNHLIYSKINKVYMLFSNKIATTDR